MNVPITQLTEVNENKTSAKYNYIVSLKAAWSWSRLNNQNKINQCAVFYGNITGVPIDNSVVCITKHNNSNSKPLRV